jgi:acetate kinase
MPALIPVLNAGSSSIKVQLFAIEGGAPVMRYRGQVEGIGTAPRFAMRDGAGETVAETSFPKDGFDHDAATTHLLTWMREHLGDGSILAIGHRVVHGGMKHTGTALVDDALLAELDTFVPLAPLHQPHNLAPIRLIRRHAPHLPQVAAFDTAFHRSQPELAQLFALPQEITDRGVRRYGFHGLSYDYIASALPSVDARLARGKVIVAHLGNGASLCALDAGRSITSTMGFSAVDGLPMGTRSGALDPAVVFYMIRDMGMSVAEAEKVLYTRSGHLGVSGLSSDMRKLREAADQGHEGARRAIGLFVYRILREMGALAACLSGVDGIVFTAGIGENDARLRADVLNSLAWAGFRLDEAANAAGGPRITAGEGPQAWVIPTNEELTIVRQVRTLVH